MDGSEVVIGRLRDGNQETTQAAPQSVSDQPRWVIADDPLLQQILSDRVLLTSVWSWLCQQVQNCTDATISPVGRHTSSSRALHVLTTASQGGTSPAHELLVRHAASLPDTPATAPLQVPALPAARQGDPVTISAESLDRHAVIFGSTGTGKSYLTYLLLREQLLRRCSLVAFDTKYKTIARLRATCHEANIPAHRVAVINPNDIHNVPGFNPFRAGQPPAQVVTQLVTLIESSNDGKSGPRMRQFLRNALVLVAWHDGTLLDIQSVLQDDGFRRRLLTTTPRHPANMQYERTVRFFTHEYLQIARSDRDASVQAVTNKFDELLGNDFFLSLLCANQNTIELPRLFREPGALLVHMDKDALGESGVKLLSGIIAHYLQAAAMRHGGKGVPVVFSLDELGTQSRFLDTALQDTTNMAREQQLRLVFATQHPGQLPPRLGQDLMENAAVKAFFRLGSEQAREVAQDLSDADDLDEGADEPQVEVPARWVEQPELCLRLRTTGPPRPVWTAPLYAFRYGQTTLTPLKLDLPQFHAAVPITPNPNPSDVIRPFVYGVQFQQPPIYVGESATRLSALVRCFQCLVGHPARLVWQNRYGYIELSLPSVQAVIEPAPKFQRDSQQGRLRSERRGKEHWVRTVRKLEIGEAVVQIQSGSPQVVRIEQLRPPVDAPRDYVTDSQAAFRTETTFSFALPTEAEAEYEKPQPSTVRSRPAKASRTGQKPAPLTELPSPPLQAPILPGKSIPVFKDDRSID